MMPPTVGVDLARRVADRYEVRGLLGTGGNATVHEVFDSARAETLAMKLLLPEAARNPTTALLFRREYRTLRELAHPAIVRAYDYGLLDGAPYYTMELAAGSDLRALAPLPWRDACAVLREVASALSLVHARRLIHRDVSAGNVLRTVDNHAKLLDFGSLCPMGVAQEVVGTPPFVAPECLDGRPLDARADLFSLGALGYYLLTGRHAYPASRLSELRRLWGHAVEPPSRTIPAIPEALDALIASLLSLSSLARPPAAAEVFDRLTAAAGLGPVEGSSVAQVGLTAPELVGRADVVARFRRRLLRSDRGRGSALVLEAAPGFGRSRLLGCLVAEANIAGATTLYASGGEGRGGAFGVTRVLARRLLEAAPPHARDTTADLAMVARLHLDDPDAQALAPAPDEWYALAASVAEWFTAASARTPLVIAVDDIDEADDASVAVVAKLAEAAASRRLLVVTTARTGRSGDAGQRLRRLGGSHALRPLRAVETHALLSSIFGDSGNIETISAWAHQLSEGCPRIAIELAQHLVDCGVARHEQGGWALPKSLVGLDLPKTLDQAIAVRIAAQSPTARRLAEALSLTVPGDPLPFDQYPALFAGLDSEELFTALNELVAGQVLVGDGASYSFVHDGMRAAFERSVPDDRRQELHRRLAEIYESTPERTSVIAAYHRLLAREEAKAFSLFYRFVSERDGYFVRAYRFLRSPEGAFLYERVFEWGVKEGAPKDQLLRIGRAVLGLAAVAFPELARHAPLVMAELEKQTGLVYWDEYEHITDPTERIRVCVARAIQRWNATPEGERGLSPREAIGEFSACTAMLAGVLSRAGETTGLVALLPQINRLRSLSPAVDIAADVVEFSANARRGWVGKELRHGVLERVSAPVPDLDETTRLGVRQLTIYYQGLESALMGERAAFDWAEKLEEYLPYVALAWQVRTVAHLFHGQEKQADLCRKKRDVAMIGFPETVRHIEVSVFFESAAYVLLGDLMALKRVLPSFRERTKSMPGWTPHCLLADGAHEALRGDLPKALEFLERALSLMTPGANSGWALTVARAADLLISLDRAAEARERAEAALAVCADRPMIPQYVDLLEASLAHAEARLGEHEAAARRAERVVARATDRGSAGVLLIELHAMQARVALEAKDPGAFASASKRVAELCLKVDSKAYASRLSSLFRLSIGAGFEPVDVATRSFRPKGGPAFAKIRTEFDLCKGAEERAMRALGMVLQQSGAHEGYLYVNQADGFVLAASRSTGPPPIEAEEWLLKWLQSFRGTGNSDETTSQGGTTFFAERFGLIALVTEDAGVAVAPAIAVIDCSGVRPRLIPDTVLREMADALIDAGDAPRSYAPGDTPRS
jgi:tetratricopeptide (TPR) repeat protein